MAEWWDNWDARRRAQQGPRPPGHNENHGCHGFLDPAGYPRHGRNTGGTGLYRARSVGHAPMPNVQVYNYNSSYQRQSPEGASRSSSFARGRSPARLYDEGLRDDMLDLRRDLRRAASRGRSTTPGHCDNGYQNWQLEHIQRDAQDQIMWERNLGYRQMENARLRDRLARGEEEERLKAAEKQVKLQAQQEKQEEEELKARIILEKEDADRKAKAEKARAVREWELKQKEEEEERKETARRAVEEYHRKQREAKEEEERLKIKFKMEEDKAKEEEKERERLWRLKQAEMEAQKEKMEKKRQEALEEEMRKKLSVFGFAENQIQAVLADPTKQKQMFQPPGFTYQPQPPPHTVTGVVAASPLVPGQKREKWFKIRTDQVAAETLEYYRIPYVIESNHYVIMQEMSQHDTDILFEHTKSLLSRPKALFIEDRGRGREPQLAFVRKKSKSRRRHSKSPIVYGPLWA